MQKLKTLNTTKSQSTVESVPDVEFSGTRDLFRVLSKASSQEEGWMKSTKAMDVPGGVVIQVTTQQRNIDFTYSVAEALTYVSGAEIEESEDGTCSLVEISIGL